MARKYLNSDGEEVILSDEHLDAAVEIYEELSKRSPSMRVSWKKHKKMLEEEGFFESDASENYRCAIKDERRSRGILPSAQKHAELMGEHRLKSIRKELGELYYQKRDIQLHANSMNRVKREITDGVLLAEVVQETLKKVDWSNVVGDIDILYDKDEWDERVVCVSNLTDIHHGYLRENEVDARKVTWSVLHRYLTRLIRFGQDEGVTHFIITNLGDEIEGYLRPSSLISTRQLAVEQTVEVSELIVKFLAELGKYFEVSYLAIAGNHSRISQNKASAMEKEDYTVLHKEIMKYACRTIGVNYIDTPYHYQHILNVNGFNLYLCHGDRDSVRNLTTLAELSTLHNIPLDIVMAGHYHTHSVTEVGDDKYQVITGSIKGSDDFSAKINKASSRSQASILFKNNGFEIRQIKID